jgi:hypothetical protein
VSSKSISILHSRSVFEDRYSIGLIPQEARLYNISSKRSTISTFGRGFVAARLGIVSFTSR